MQQEFEFKNGNENNENDDEKKVESLESSQLSSPNSLTPSEAFSIGLYNENDEDYLEMKEKYEEKIRKLHKQVQEKNATDKSINKMIDVIILIIININ